MTTAVSAKTVSAIEARPQPREGNQSRADVFRATLDRMPTADAGSTGRTGLMSATTVLSDGYSRPMAGLEQQVIRLTVSAEDAVEGRPSIGHEADDDVSGETRKTDQSEPASREIGTAAAQLAVALMVPPREIARSGERAEGGGDDAAEAGVHASDGDKQPVRGPTAAAATISIEPGHADSVSTLQTAEPPRAEGSSEGARANGFSPLDASQPGKTDPDPKPAAAPAGGQPAPVPEAIAEAVQSGSGETRGDASVSGNTRGPAVDAPEIVAVAPRTSGSARDAVAVAKAVAVSVLASGPDEAQPGQAIQPSTAISDASLETVEFVASAKQPVVNTMVPGTDQAVAQAATVSSSVMPGRSESVKSSRIVTPDTKPQTDGASSAPTTPLQHKSPDVSTALTSERTTDRNAGAETTQADLPQSNDEAVERTAVESGNRDTGRGLNASTSPATPPAPVSANPTTLATPAAAVLEAIRSEAAWTAHLGNTRPGAPGEVKSLKISLTPVELGNVVAHLTVEDESVSVELTAETSEAQSRLAADTDAIVKSLRAIGLEVDRVTVQLAPRADVATQADTGAGARQQGFAADSGAGDARGQSSGSQTGRNSSATEDPTVRTDTSATPNRNASSRYI